MANKFFFLNGGSETVFFQERDFLQTSGVEIVDFAMHDERNFNSAYADNFVRVREYRNSSSIFEKIKAAASLIHSPEAVKNFSALIKAERPDVVHCHNIYHQLTPSIIGAAHRLNVPVVLTLHDYKPVCPTYVRLRNGKVCSDCLGGDFFNVMKYRCADGSLSESAILFAEAVVQRLLGNYEKVSRVIAPSHFMAQSIASRFAENKVTVIHNGIDLNTVSADHDDGDYALYLGRLSHEKGIATLLEAYKTHGINFPLKICGTGPLLQTLSAGVPANIEFLGYQTGEVLQAIIRRASMVVVPSEWYENCPMSILEAMAYGKSVVAADIGGIPELVADNRTGLLYEAGNVSALAACIQNLANNKLLRSEMGSAGKRRVENEFSLQQHNASLMQVYSELI